MIVSESVQHGDILQANFVDSFDTLSLKHLIGLKWLDDSECIGGKRRKNTGPLFVVKVDDDVFVEVFHLVKFVRAVYGNVGPEKALVCDVIPRSTGTTEHSPPGYRCPRHPNLPDLSMSGGPVDSLVESESVGDDIGFDVYPEHCSRAAYLMTPNLAADFLKAAKQVPATPPDDVYVTGHLREVLKIKPFFLNLRYTYEPKSYEKWLLGSSTLPLPYLFAALGKAKDWQVMGKQMWLKTTKVHQRFKLYTD